MSSDSENMKIELGDSTYGSSLMRSNNYSPEYADDFREQHLGGEGELASEEEVPVQKIQFNHELSNMDGVFDGRTDLDVIQSLQAVNYSENSSISMEHLRTMLGVGVEEYKKVLTTADEMIEQAVLFFPKQWKTAALVSESPIFRISISPEQFEFITLSYEKRSELEEPLRFFDRNNFQRMFCPIPVNIGFVAGVQSKLFVLRGEWANRVPPPHGRMLMPRISDRLNDDVEEVIIEDVLLTQNFTRQICRSRNVKYLSFHRCFALESIMLDTLTSLVVLHCDIIMVNPDNILTINLRSNLARVTDITVVANHILRSDTPEMFTKASLKQISIPGLETRDLHRLELYFDGDDWPLVLGLVENMTANAITDEHGNDLSQIEPVRRGFIAPAHDSRSKITVLKLNASLPANAQRKLPWVSSRDVMMTLMTPNVLKKHTYEALKKMKYELGRQDDEIYFQSLMRHLKYDSKILLPRMALGNLLMILEKRQTQVLTLNTGAAVSLQIVPFMGTLNAPEGGRVPDITSDPNDYKTIEEMLYSNNKNLTAILLEVEAEVDLRQIGFDTEKKGNLYLFPTYDVMMEKEDESVPVPYDPNCRKRAFNIEFRDFFSWHDSQRRINYPFTLAFITKALVTVPACGKHIKDQKHFKSIVDDFSLNFQQFSNNAVEGQCGKITSCNIQ